MGRRRGPIAARNSSDVLHTHLYLVSSTNGITDSSLLIMEIRLKLDGYGYFRVFGRRFNQCYLDNQKPCVPICLTDRQHRILSENGFRVHDLCEQVS